MVKTTTNQLKVWALVAALVIGGAGYASAWDITDGVPTFGAGSAR